MTPKLFHQRDWKGELKIYTDERHSEKSELTKGWTSGSTRNWLVWPKHLELSIVSYTLSLSFIPYKF